MKSSRTSQSLAQPALLKLMYNDDRLGTPISGDEASVGALGLETLKSLYRQSVHPGGLVIGVFGDATQAEVTKHLKTQLAGWVAQGERKRPPEAAFAPKVRIHLVDKPDLTQVNVHLGHAGIKRNRGDFEAVTAMNYALGGGGYLEPSDEADPVGRRLTYGIRSGFSSGERRSVYDHQLYPGRQGP